MMDRFAMSMGAGVAAFGAIVIILSILLDHSRADLLLAVGSLFVLIGLGVAVPAAQRFIFEMYRNTLAFLKAVWPGGSKNKSGRDEPDEEKPSLDLPFESDPKPDIATVWKAADDVRRPILDLIGPAYVLDATYHFLDWNPAFDLLIAAPLGLRRGQHATEFVRHLEDVHTVAERAKAVFPPGREPLVDVEPLEFVSEAFGLIRFEKVAAQIADPKGNTLAWTVSLNIVAAENAESLWEAVRGRMDRYVRWSKYAVSYDQLLLNFDDYLSLVNSVVRFADGRQRCIDLGAGTGNVTMRLLESQNTRDVWAVEENEMMLDYLRHKVQVREKKDNRDYSSRLTIVKEDIARLDELPREYFDAALCVNVLYAVDDPERCLRQAAGLLKPGGVLGLSTSHSETDVDALFGKMREVLVAKGQFDRLRTNFENARLIHQGMEDKIVRDTREEVRRLLERTGFRIDEWREREYVNAVVVAKAVKI